MLYVLNLYVICQAVLCHYQYSRLLDYWTGDINNILCSYVFYKLKEIVQYPKHGDSYTLVTFSVTM